ncbi:CDP-glycerol glycerophosphotransferase family protein [Mammaliicoccus sciuri]|uniref:CDP-glycerol glycerophosphotransferase family protein n=1 Tax=Mammaliicoccus sciuri TaxID=1296 RepID=UPI00194DFE0E|nr:CDP-glycerol glycerophosphotransferase family protein [Mammaliicoccus sciuri]MCD8836207.1 CDP-glycerol glycerophosphotransferase family protein [Mammaliicoccus sciuri]MCJ0963986.1 CDP-glycerol glycerophosphotransferase family protein [Mammaliicoccus sciuri]
MEIKVENKCFVIENLKESQIKLSNNGINKSFDSVNGKIVIKFEDLQELLKEKNQPLFFKSQHDEDIIVNNEIHKFGHTSIKKKKATYYIYITKENKIAVIYNKRPALLNFYNKNGVLEDVNVVNNQLIMKMSFECYNYKPTYIEGKIKVRNKDIEIIVNGKIIDINQNMNTFKVTAQLEIKLEELEYLFLGDVPFYKYNSDIYDISINYQIDEMLISKYYARLKFSQQNKYLINDENWLEFSDTFMLLCRPYPTIYGNLSMRLIPVPKDTYQYYISGSVMQRDNNKESIVCLEYPEKAQENGLIFFKWLVKKYGKKLNIYYLISSASNDLENLKGYENHIIYYKSKENLAIAYNASVICHSHSAGYVLPFATNKTEQMINQKNRVFLQHGIIGSKDVSSIYGRKPNDKIADLFVVSSNRERELVHKDYGFENNEIILTGLPRFDEVIKTRKDKYKKFKNKNKILIMPTWRTGMHTFSDEKFMESNYYKEFQTLINNPKIYKLIEEKGYKVSLYLHRNFQVFNKLFSSEYIEILSERDHDVKDLLAEYQVLITDYSSVGLDFALMHKKVLYYRPKEILGDDFVEETTDLLPGKVITTQDELMSELINTSMYKEHKNNLDKIYKYSDKKACKRIAEEMLSYFNLNRKF